MGIFHLRSLLFIAIVVCNCITWTSSRHHYTHNVNGHRSRHRRQGAGLYLSASYVLPGGEGQGAWGEWGEVSPCSRTCGGGVASQKRICLEFSPDGQPQCTGGNTKYFSCQTQDCPEGSMDFRAEQCAAFDDKLFRNRTFKWIPYIHTMKPCELNCMPRGERFYNRQAEKVIDGTRCSDDSFDVCVDGVCQPVGCDMMLGSRAQEDKCRQCRGNGTNCHTTSGIIDTQDLIKGYNDILLIPEGATNIVIAELRTSDNYLALRGKEDNHYYLNGDYHIDFPRSFMIAGSLWHYERSQQGFAAPDRLRSLGPTNESLYLSLLLQSTNVGIEYEYSVPSALAPPPNQQYQWVHEEFSECSVPCGGGYQTRQVSCRTRDDLELVDDNLCDTTFKPITNQTCNKQACSPEWMVEPWGPCSKPCGDGGIRSRKVFCQKIITNGDTFRFPSMVADEECIGIHGSKPNLYQECNRNETCPTWFTGPWKPCNKLCGEGKQSRQVVCHQRINGRVQVFDDGECSDEKPPVEQSCELRPCNGQDWVVSEWSGCDTCLSTVRTRTASCVTKQHFMVKVVNSSLCSYHPMPVLEEPCDKTKLPSCEVQWYATQWSPCSTNCGKGIQTRRVFCGSFDGSSVLKVDDSRCDSLLKYNDTKECELPKEKCPAKWYTGPWSECSKKCGGGEQVRHAACLDGGKEVGTCDPLLSPDRTQTCNIGPCDADQMLPVDAKSTTIMDEETYDDCDEDEEEDYPEVGAEELNTKTTQPEDLMFSDSPSTIEGSGGSTSFSEIESEFTRETDTTEGSGSDLTSFGTMTTSYIDSTANSATTEKETTSDQTESSVTSSDLLTTPGTTAETKIISEITATGETQVTTEITTDETGSTADKTGRTTDVTESTTDVTSSDLSTTPDTTVETTTISDITATGETKVTMELTTDETGSTIDVTRSTVDETGTTTDLTGTTLESTTDVTSSDLSTTSDITVETGSTIDVIGSTTDVTGSATDETLITSEVTESIGSTTETTTIVMDENNTTTEDTETTTDFTGSTDLSTDNTETTLQTDAATESTTDEGTTDSTETVSTETTLISSTETSVIDSITELSTTANADEGSSTTESIGSTDAESPGTTGGTTEITDSSGTTTEQSASTQEVTEYSGSTTEEAETTYVTTGASDATTEETDSSGSTTEETDFSGSTTEETDSSGSTTEGTNATEETSSTSTDETTESGSTTEASSETTTESTESIEIGSTTELSSTTENVSESSSTTEEESTGAGSTTPSSDWSTIVEVFTGKKHCRPRKKINCSKSKFGCCPDRKTPARGPFDEGCKNPETCKESKFGCCPDGVSPASGAHNKGCPTPPCKETLFGCCLSDNTTAAEGNDQEGCPPPQPACHKSKYGCCKDNETEAKGLWSEGCPETQTTMTTTEMTEPLSTTATVSGCANTAFGCCFDNETDASGPNGEGCPCSISEFGCCPDGVTTALVNMTNCEASCNTTVYGCCQDGETAAHGPEFEGCCLLSQFGCCPDNYKPADGPNREGCGCEYSHFGCCPDNVTIARGPNKEGCGCEYTQFGCCPDRHTEAKGRDYEGCGCHTYQFGCCPDGEKIATGPDQQGCRCEQSKFGCCGDGVTPASAPNKRGCDCSNSQYGCCPDGVTEAKGKKFLNCTDVIENKQAACALPNDRGTCVNYTVYWYYDNEYGGCSRFWYGGCDGNANRFSSQEECEDVCVHPSPKDACNLPMSKGACSGYNVHWYYDAATEHCAQFVYGGCLGNDNNFDSRELCEKQCEPQKTEDQCNLPIESGPCAGNYLRWGYDFETKTCAQFVWGGCGGNPNRFTSEAACMLRCRPPGTPEDKCSLAQDVGNCTEKIPVWSFSLKDNVCVPFYYKGCGGNDNRFSSERECAESCPSTYVQEVCTLPALTGECANYTLRWFFDTARETCRQFFYGGCGGNENNFETENECENRCSDRPVTTTVTPVPNNVYTTEFCFKSQDSGPCTSFETRWAYDVQRAICVEFEYGGCGGNENNFPSLEHCQYYCHAITDICQLPMVSGPCEESLMRWFYDTTTSSCNRFAYGGCEGNENRFNTLEECENRCGSSEGRAPPATTIATYTTPIAATDDLRSECRIAALEECREAGRVWYLEQSHRACVSHDNRDSGAYCRHTGVFPTEEACERACGAFVGLDVCRYEVNPGYCTKSIPKYYFDGTNGRCEQFLYGGCQGGPNRFSTIEECEQVCKPDPCKLGMEPGNCLGSFISWYYDQEYDDCRQFIYGGCNGNDNRFDSREDCQNRCKKLTSGTVTVAYPPVVTTTVASAQQLVDVECQAPESLEPCGENITIYYYDAATKSCISGNFGSCRYPNSYRTEEECLRKCGAFKGLDVCSAQLDPGPCLSSIPKVYWDATTGRCSSFTYGGCHGGANRFSTEEECDEVCGGSGPEAVCLLPVETGVVCGAAMRRWYYSAGDAECLPFVYSGCGGNDNNFRSYRDCALHCKISSNDIPEAPRVNPDTVPEVSGNVGDRATLRCLFHGNPPPRITWRKGEITIDGDGGHYRVLSDGTLEIASLYRNDSGVYICIAENNLGRATQEIRLEVNDMTSNEVTPVCDEYIAECNSLRCEYGLQRTRTSVGCERCSCVRVEVDCEPLASECRRLRCTYGVDRRIGQDGCERCRCIDSPCSGRECAPGERCVTTIYNDPISRESRYYAECRIVNKTGYCPVEDGRVSTENQCRRECNDDADCLGVDKCCVRGCSQLCLQPAAPTRPPRIYGPGVPQAPRANPETEPQVTANEGGKASLRCLFHGNPPPKITWRKGEITINGDVDRYKVLSDGTLEIVSLYRNDSGVYICVAENNLGRATQEIRLEVNDPVDSPVAIAGIQNEVIVGELGKPLTLRCLAYGYPKPAIYWYRGRNGPMVPFSSSLYEARGNTLQIRRLSVDILGEYICQAYNGNGKPAEWSVTVQEYRAEDPNEIPVIPQTNEAPPRQVATEAPTNPPTTTPFVPVYIVPVKTSILATSTRLNAGAEINLKCEIDGYPVPEVYWTKDGARITSNDRIKVTEARVTVSHATINDSGVYGCHASNIYSSHFSSEQINVEGLFIPPTCKDNPYFANCELIVRSKYCHHKYYSSFCCKSCVEAGLLDPMNLEMQADQPWYTRK